MHDFYTLSPGEKPGLRLHIETLHLCVKLPIMMAVDVLTEHIEITDNETRKAIDGALSTINLALIAWNQIDAKMEEEGRGC